jgi:hypothetical protein
MQKMFKQPVTIQGYLEVLGNNEREAEKRIDLALIEANFSVCKPNKKGVTLFYNVNNVKRKVISSGG